MSSRCACDTIFSDYSCNVNKAFGSEIKDCGCPDGRCTSMKPRWRRSEEKVITDEFSRTSRLDEAINAQRGIATPSSTSLAVLVRAGREEPILLIHICFLSFYPRYSLSTYSHDRLKLNFHKASRSTLVSRQFPIITSIGNVWNLEIRNLPAQKSCVGIYVWMLEKYVRRLIQRRSGKIPFFIRYEMDDKCLWAYTKRRLIRASYSTGD